MNIFIKVGNHLFKITYSLVDIVKVVFETLYEDHIKMFSARHLKYYSNVQYKIV